MYAASLWMSSAQSVTWTMWFLAWFLMLLTVGALVLGVVGFVGGLRFRAGSTITLALVGIALNAVLCTLWAIAALRYWGLLLATGNSTL